ncbi:MAG: UDP-N-acetylglucosamine 1-carboxyvinyltransferase [Phycisphaerales bacterium]|nr:UDP-N-acetylglucosamine 1-carboxyvinyltransferase [Phycisphaerales bacterium]
MQAFRIQGGTPLTGQLAVDGSKNAALPLMAASLLSPEPVLLHGVPPLADVNNMVNLLGELGVQVERQDRDMKLSVVDESRLHARYDIVKTMRASICTLGPMLARRGEARISMPGGCAIGDRPVDLHLRGLEAMGADITLEGGDIIARAKRLKGTTIFLGGPFGSTVLGTANIMSAAVLAEGVTIIESAACEPEIADLARLLNAMGACISGAGTPRVTIKGVDELHSTEHHVLPDRIVAGTLAIGAALSKGDVQLLDFPWDHLLALTHLLQEIGVTVERVDPNEPCDRCTVRVAAEGAFNPVLFTTQPYPGFPTDLQAQLMALLCLARGNSIVTEKIYPDRFMHVPELNRMGAKLVRQGPTVVVQGVPELIGAPVMASDLRGSASLILAGIAARGETIVSRVYHVDRGYFRLEEQLNALGAQIQRVDSESGEVIGGVPCVVTRPLSLEAPTIATAH